MKKRYLLLFLLWSILIFGLSRLLFDQYRLSSTVDILQKQFNLLADDVVFTQYESILSVIDGEETGRTSIHDYPSLGIKIYSEDPYSKGFKLQKPFVIKDANMLIDPFSPSQYIEVIAKNPNENIENIFKENYFMQYTSGCKIFIETGNSLYFTGNSSHNIIIYSVSSVTLDHECHIGKVPYEKYSQVWYNTKKPDRYYLVNMIAGCAPGKCNVFNQVELY